MAKNIQAQIDQCINDFARQLESLVREAAVDAVQAALGGGSSMSAAPRRAPAAASHGPVAGKVGKRASKKRGKRAGRRGGVAVDAQTVLNALSKEDGLRINQLVSMLGANQDALKITLTELMDAKVIEKKGKARGTTYHIKRK